jgi:predicted neutral ceramidase superfamily lipid hydrolase
MLPVAVMGFTTIVAEVALILAFQSRLGLVYSKISLLFTVFMFGLFLGSTLARTWFSVLCLKHLTAVQGGFVILLVIARFSLGTASEAVFYSLLLMMGILGGFLFAVSNAIYLNKRARYGLGYSLDLFGSFLGAFLATSIFIPLLGLELLFSLLLLVNSFCLGFIAIRAYLINQHF